MYIVDMTWISYSGHIRGKQIIEQWLYNSMENKKKMRDCMYLSTILSVLSAWLSLYLLPFAGGSELCNFTIYTSHHRELYNTGLHVYYPEIIHMDNDKIKCNTFSQLKIHWIHLSRYTLISRLRYLSCYIRIFWNI